MKKNNKHKRVEIIHIAEQIFNKNKIETFVSILNFIVFIPIIHRQIVQIFPIIHISHENINRKKEEKRWPKIWYSWINE